MSEIKDCPWCAYSSCDIAGAEGFCAQVMCPMCGACGPSKDTEVEAIAAWNALCEVVSEAKAESVRHSYFDEDADHGEGRHHVCNCALCQNIEALDALRGDK